MVAGCMQRKARRSEVSIIDLRTESGAKLTRVPDVFDCWFESGAMPYGEAHYPFEKGKSKNLSCGNGDNFIASYLFFITVQEIK